MKAIYGDRPTVPYWLLGAYVGPTRQARSAAGGALMTVAALRTELQRLGYEYLKDAVDHISRILSEHSLAHIQKGETGKGESVASTTFYILLILSLHSTHTVHAYLRKLLHPNHTSVPTAMMLAISCADLAVASLDLLTYGTILVFHLTRVQAIVNVHVNGATPSTAARQKCTGVKLVSRRVPSTAHESPRPHAARTPRP